MLYLLKILPSTTEIKVIDLKDTSKIFLLKGHTKAVRRVTWHPSGALLVRLRGAVLIVMHDHLTFG